jgi:hypothetical protein
MENKIDADIPGYNFTHTKSPQFPKRRSPHSSKAKYPDFSKILPQTEEKKQIEPLKYSSKTPQINNSKSKRKQLNITLDAKTSTLDKEPKPEHHSKVSHKRHYSKVVSNTKPPINLLKNQQLNSRGRSSSRLMNDKQQKYSSGS